MSQWARVYLALLIVTAGYAHAATKEGGKMGISEAPFGQTPDGSKVVLYTLTNAHGMEATITNFGGIVQSLKTADRNGEFADIVLGHDKLEGYVGKHPYFGAIVGRYGNRIAKGQFTLDGKLYQLALNDGPNTLHGGVKGFDKYVWSSTPFEDTDAVGLKLMLTSPDGDEGYPGKLSMTVTYKLTNDNALEIHYEAVTDAPTVLNLTNHSYFNLEGAGTGDILGHEVMIQADCITPVDKTLIPTGMWQSVEKTPFDFRTAKAIGKDIGVQDEQIKLGKGYDHNFELSKTVDGALELAARVYAAKSGRVMEVYTTEPGMQFYTGNFLDGTDIGKGGVAYKHRYGFCMETQHYPDSPNQRDFPDRKSVV